MRSKRDLDPLDSHNDVTMIKNYSPQYFQRHLSGLKMELEDVYSRSASRIMYQDYKIYFGGESCESLAMKSIAISNIIDKDTKAYEEHQEQLKRRLEKCTPEERKAVRKYLREGFKEYLQGSTTFKFQPLIITTLKRDLYRFETTEEVEKEPIDQSIIDYYRSFGEPKVQKTEGW